MEDNLLYIWYKLYLMLRSWQEEEKDARDSRWRTQLCPKLWHGSWGFLSFGVTEGKGSSGAEGKVRQVARDQIMQSTYLQSPNYFPKSNKTPLDLQS
jgi:hypothetical protein